MAVVESADIPPFSRLGSWGWRSILVLGWLSVILAVVLPMLQQGYPSTHSTHFNLSWGFQYQQQFTQGQFYPRWLEFSNFGFGNATFAFYPPLCMVTTLPFHLLGLDLGGTLVASMALAVGILGLGFYRYGRCFWPAWIAAGVAGVGMVSPYFLVDVYQRGAIGEVWAIALIPWVLWASQAVLTPPHRWKSVITLALAYGLLVLSHLPTLLIFTLIWIPLPVLMAWRQRSWQGLLRSYAGAALAFCWTAFFLWPAALDQRFIQVGALNSWDEYLPHHRLMLRGLLQLRPVLTDHWFDRSLLGIWWVTIAITVGVSLCTLGSLLGSQRPALSGQAQDPDLQTSALYWLLVSGVTLLLMTDLLGWVYPWVLPLQRIQFSWRWLSITTVMIPLLLGYLLSLGRHWGRRTVTAIFALLVMAGLTTLTWQGIEVIESAGFNASQVKRFQDLAAQMQFPHQPPPPTATSEQFIHWHWILRQGLALVDVPEYRARGVTMGMPPEVDHPLLSWKGGGDRGLDLTKWRFGYRQFQANNTQDQPRQVMLRMFYYPAWRIRLDDHWVTTEKSEQGQLQITIPPGQHQVQVAYLGTLADWLGCGVSLITLAGLGVLLSTQPAGTQNLKVNVPDPEHDENAVLSEEAVSEAQEET